MWSITNFFKNSTINNEYRTTNEIFNILATEKQTNIKISGIYVLKYNTCNSANIGQMGRKTSIRFNEHMSYIKTNNPHSGMLYTF